MSVIKPFAALRPLPAHAAAVAAPPYDVVSTVEARAHAGTNPSSFFRVSRPEIELPDSTDPHSDAVYELGRTNLARFIADGTLRPESGPKFYFYRQEIAGHRQVGLVACASVDEYDRGAIKKHELTRNDKEDDRVAHIDRLSAHDEPVFLAYRARADLDALQARVLAAAPETDFTAEDGVRHTLWVIDAATEREIATAFASVPALYIADGHHRSAAASRVAAKRGGSGDAEHRFFLSVLFPHNQLRILDYNRLVRDLKGLTPEAFRARVEEKFDVAAGTGKPTQRHQFGMFLGGRWYLLTARAGSFPEASPVAALDVSILQENLLAPILGIGDPRKDERIAFVGGIRGMPELEKRVGSGEHAVAFAMFPTSLDELMSIADAGEIMPPKSTWFEPKLRSGLFVHRF